jgi:hypothetical protein
MIRSWKETFDIAVSLAGTARTASANGTAIDLANYQSTVIAVVPVSWTDGNHVLKLQDSPDNSVWTDVAASQLDGTMPTINAGVDATFFTRVGYLGARRYLRAVATVSGTTTGAVYSVIALRGSPRKMPK